MPENRNFSSWIHALAFLQGVIAVVAVLAIIAAILGNQFLDRREARSGGERTKGQ